MADDPSVSLDEIDQYILYMLSENPRIPYSDIAAKLEEKGYQMSAEGIRYRVNNLYETTSMLLLTDPKKHGWLLLRVFLRTNGGQSGKNDVYQTLSEMGFWLVSRTIGTYDIYAVATVPSHLEADEILTDVRGMEGVDTVDFAIETERETDITNYFSYGSED